MIKENIITLQDGGVEKRFKIKQMTATKGELFIYKFALLVGANADLSKMSDASDLFNAVAGQPFEKVQELLDLLLSCVSRVHDGGIESQLTPENVDSFVEDKGTLMRLRVEAFTINSFFQGDGVSALSGLGDGAVAIKRKA